MLRLFFLVLHGYGPVVFVSHYLLQPFFFSFYPSLDDKLTINTELLFFLSCFDSTRFDSWGLTMTSLLFFL